MTALAAPSAPQSMLAKLGSIIRGAVPMLAPPASGTRPEDERRETQKILAYMEGLKIECESSWKTILDGRTLSDIWNANPRLYLGDQWGTQSVPGNSNLVEGGREYETGDPRGGRVKRCTLNRVQGALISDWAIQFEKPIRSVFQARESGDPPSYFLDPVAAGVLQQLVQQGVMNPTGFTPGQLAGAEAMNDLQAHTLRQAGLDSDFLIEVNDRTCAEVQQTTFEALWDNANGDMVMLQAVELRGIYGHQPVLFEWDRERNCFTLECLPIRQCWVDPTKPWIDKFDYLEFRQWMGAEQAKQDYPQFADDIETASAEGNLITGHDQARARYSGVMRQTDFHRKMIPVDVMFERHVRYAMTVDEAIRYGKVVESQEVTPDVETGENATTDVFLLVDEDGNTTATQVKPDQDANGMPVDENWPTIKGIRHTVSFPTANIVVSRGRCAYWDMPVTWLKNLDLPNLSPWGIGDPMRLASLQEAINREFTYAVNILNRLAFPPEMWPQSVLDYLNRKGNGGSNSAPGRKIGVKDDLWVKYYTKGVPAFMQSIPSDVSGHIQVLMAMLKEFDQLSGHVEVLQGQAPSGSSGIQVERLTANARGPSGLKAMYTEWAVERVANLAKHGMCQWLPPSEWAKYNGKYARPVKMPNGRVVYPALEEILKRLKLDNINVSAEAAPGRGLFRNLKAALVTQARTMNAISNQGFLEGAEIPVDAKVEAERIVTEQVTMAKALAEAQGQAGLQNGAGGGSVPQVQNPGSQAGVSQPTQGQLIPPAPPGVAATE